MELLLIIFVALFCYSAYQYAMDIVATKGAIAGVNEMDKPTSEKIDILVAKLARQDYMVHDRTEKQVQLKRKKRFSFLAALAWLLVFGVGLLVYIIWYMAKRDKNLTCTFDSDGKIIA